MEVNNLKKDKIIIILIIIVIICIGGIIGMIYKLNKGTVNNESEIDEIFEQEESGAEYTSEELDNIEFELKNLDSNIKEKIKYNKFELSLKEYIYKKGLIQASYGTYISSTESENQIIIKIKLNDTKNTTITAIVDTNDYTYEFSNN